MPVTDNPDDPGLNEIDTNTKMQKSYLVLPDGRRKDFVRPLRYSYIHQKCNGTTSMSEKLAETYAADPSFYGATYCATCRDHFPVGVLGEFVWTEDGSKVGS